MADVLSAEEVRKQMKKVPEWELEGKAITKTIEFETFSDAIDYVNGVAEIAEDHDHHPDIDIRYTKVLLSLSTHSAGGLTPADFEAAAAIDSLEG
ncbi:MAG: 4a-hydroxytetrahydrobiopterin dehydratase [Verrucomicrobia bacterium]|jgi:4a-hydroxytetrahydrobiopterin dehydratase|nr:MAG: 4a-hydroxytetrahydrobiopterin dehydratase [Verrucomicrobiota bacterium]